MKTINSRSYYVGHAAADEHRVDQAHIALKIATAGVAAATAALKHAEDLRNENRRRFAAFERTGMTLDAKNGICRKPRCPICERGYQSADDLGIAHGVLTEAPLLSPYLTMTTESNPTDEAIAYRDSLAR